MVGLDYAVNRYYSSATSRFTSRDPYRATTASVNNSADPGSWNRYGYALGDPVRFYDPTGLLVIDPPPIDVPMPDWLGPFPPPLPMPDPPVPEPVPPAAPEPECFAQLKYRGVDDWRAGLVGATHSFWWVQDSTGQQYILSGGPQTYAASTTQFLEIWAVPGNVNGKDNVGQKTAWESGLASSLCDQIDRMVGAAKRFPRHSIFCDPIFGPNSNSAAAYLAHVATFWPTAPPGALGWNTDILVP